jgi:hypothetical protein
MLLRVGIMLLVTGAALLAMGWFDPFGPLVMIFGSCCGAVALESLLDVEPWNGEATPEVDVAETGAGTHENVRRVA